MAADDAVGASPRGRAPARKPSDGRDRAAPPPLATGSARPVETAGVGDAQVDSDARRPDDDEGGVSSLEVSRDLRTVFATRKDGTRLRVYHDDNKRMEISKSSERSNWALVEWTEPDAVGGSLGGRVETIVSLLSVDHRRLLSPRDLGLDGAAHFLDFERQGATEVLVVKSGRVEQRIELGTLDALARARPKR